MTDCLAIVQGDAVATLEKQGGVEAPGLFLNELQTVLLSHQTTVEEDGETLF